jgi:hypothetical protein
MEIFFLAMWRFLCFRIAIWLKIGIYLQKTRSMVLKCGMKCPQKGSILGIFNVFPKHPSRQALFPDKLCFGFQGLGIFLVYENRVPNTPLKAHLGFIVPRSRTTSISHLPALATACRAKQRNGKSAITS